MKNIEKASKEFSINTDFFDIENIDINKFPINTDFVAGALSDAAKEYWQEQFRQNNDLYIALKLKGMYTEEEVWKLLMENSIILLDSIQAKLERKPSEKPDLLKWFENVKKK